MGVSISPASKEGNPRMKTKEMGEYTNTTPGFNPQIH